MGGGLSPKDPTIANPLLEKRVAIAKGEYCACCLHVATYSMLAKRCEPTDSIVVFLLIEWDRLIWIIRRDL